MIDDLYAEIILKMRGEQKFKEEEIKNQRFYHLSRSINTRIES